MSADQPASSPAARPSSSKPGHTAHLLIFLTVFIDLLGFGIVIPILPLYAEKFGATKIDNGFLVAIYSLMQVLCTPLWGKLSDRIGRRPVLIISTLGTALGFFLMAVAGPLGSLILLFVARAIDGASGGNISTASAYLADITPPEKRARMMGLIGAAFGLGFVFGPMVAGLLGWVHHSLPFWFAGILALANSVFIFLKLPESLTPERRVKQSEKATLREIIERGNPQLPGVMFIYFLAITAFSVMTTLYALNTTEMIPHLKENERTASLVNGLLFAIVGIVGAVIQGRYIGSLTSRFGEKRLALTGAVILALFLALLHGRDAIWSIALVSIGIAVGNSLITPSLNSIASRGSDATAQGRTMGLMGSAGSVGRVVGPILSGPLAAWHLKPFWWAAALMIAAAVFILQLHPHDSGKPVAGETPTRPDADSPPGTSSEDGDAEAPKA